MHYSKIKESANPLLSPVVMVPKPDRSVCLCNDFKWLNQVSVFYRYPLPCVVERPVHLNTTPHKRLLASGPKTRGSTKNSLQHNCQATGSTQGSLLLIQRWCNGFEAWAAPQTTTRDELLRKMVKGLRREDEKKGEESVSMGTLFSADLASRHFPALHWA